jgi:hypothetical protein
MPASKSTSGSGPSLDTAQPKLITANHILHHHCVLDWNGSISVRNPDNASTFLMSHDQPPALVIRADDLIEFKIEDGEPKDGKKIDVSERYIHSEIYKRFSDVNSVVHSHSADVLPYTVSEVPLKPVAQMVGFLGMLSPQYPIPSTFVPAPLSPHNLIPTLLRNRRPRLGHRNRIHIQLQPRPPRPRRHSGCLPLIRLLHHPDDNQQNIHQHPHHHNRRRCTRSKHRPRPPGRPAARPRLHGYREDHRGSCISSVLYAGGSEDADDRVSDQKCVFRGCGRGESGC